MYIKVVLSDHIIYPCLENHIKWREKKSNNNLYKYIFSKMELLYILDAIFNKPVNVVITFRFNSGPRWSSSRKLATISRVYFTFYFFLFFSYIYPLSEPATTVVNYLPLYAAKRLERVACLDKTIDNLLCKIKSPKRTIFYHLF